MNPNHRDDNDPFAGTHMSIPDHLEDLRVHLWRALKGFVVALIFSFLIGNLVLEFITAPVKTQLQAFQQRRIAGLRNKLTDDPELSERNKPCLVYREVNVRALAEALGLPAPRQEWWRLPTRTRPLEDALDNAEASLAINEPTLRVFTITEGFLVLMKVCFGTAFVLGSPWIFYQIWLFIAVGLYPGEKRFVYLLLPFSLGLFLGGMALCQFVVMPKAIEYLLWFNEWLGFEPDLRLSEWLGFAIFLPLVFGISFQTPLAMLCVNRIGLVSVESYQRQRKIAWFALAFFAAFVTPTPDPINMLFLWVPLGLLYELGIGLCVFLRNAAPLDMNDYERDDLVEV